jgi:phosphoenolpyruvate synthase/pyruvate phosphate dikinase
VDTTQLASRRRPADRALILDFAHIDADMLPIVGGKAANLGALTQAQLPVPPGFCVTTEAYRGVSAGAGLDNVLDELAITPAQEVPALSRLAARARELMLAAPLPADVSQAVITEYTRLGADTPVAVRSSATAEDLPFASFAGQQDTYLNVVGSDAVLDAVRRCWLRCGLTVRSPTGRPTVSTIIRFGSPLSSSAWSTRTLPACCSPPTR